MSTRFSTSNTNLNSVDFTPKILIPVYQQQESPPVSPTHSDMYPNQVNIIHKKNYKKTHFTPNVEWIKLDYFSSRNNTKRAYFQTLLPQASNALRKQYEKYMNQKKMKIHFFHWFFLLRKQRKQIISLRNEEGHQLAIKHSESVQDFFFNNNLRIRFPTTLK